MKLAIDIVERRLEHLKKDLLYNKSALHNDSVFDLTNSDMYARIHELEYILKLLKAIDEQTRSESGTS